MFGVGILVFVEFTTWSVVVGGIEPRPKSLEVLRSGFIKELAKVIHLRNAWLRKFVAEICCIPFPHTGLDGFTHAKEPPPHCNR